MPPEFYTVFCQRKRLQSISMETKAQAKTACRTKKEAALPTGRATAGRNASGRVKSLFGEPLTNIGGKIKKYILL
jgi:hypothetical protein